MRIIVECDTPPVTAVVLFTPVGAILDSFSVVTNVVISVLWNTGYNKLS